MAADFPDPAVGFSLARACWNHRAMLAGVQDRISAFRLAVGAQGADALSNFVQRYALVPCEYTGQCAVVPGAPYPLWITMFTSMFMHGGWEHILGNMLYLYVFGNHVERSLGHVPYVAFYLLCGLGANGLEIATAVNSNVPGLGASGQSFASSHVLLGCQSWGSRSGADPRKARRMEIGLACAGRAAEARRALAHAPHRR